MIKNLLVLVMSLVSVYWLGGRVRTNPRVDALLTTLENGYTAFHNKVKNSTISDVVTILRPIYGWLALLTGVAFFMLGKVGVQSPIAVGLLSAAFLFCLSSWAAIKWVSEHRLILRNHASMVSMMVFGPLVIGVLSRMSVTPLIDPLYAHLVWTVSLLGMELPINVGQVWQGAIMSIIIFTIIVGNYLLAWLFAVFVAYPPILVALAPVYLTKCLDRLFPGDAFLGFTVFLYLAATFGLMSL